VDVAPFVGVIVGVTDGVGVIVAVFEGVGVGPQLKSKSKALK